MSKPSKSQPYVTRLPDGRIYSQHRHQAPEGRPSLDGQPTMRAIELLVKQDKRETRRQKRLKEQSR